MIPPYQRCAGPRRGSTSSSLFSWLARFPASRRRISVINPTDADAENIDSGDEGSLVDHASSHRRLPSLPLRPSNVRSFVRQRRQAMQAAALSPRLAYAHKPIRRALLIGLSDSEPDNDISGGDDAGSSSALQTHKDVDMIRGLLIGIVFSPSHGNAFADGKLDTYGYCESEIVVMLDRKDVNPLLRPIKSNIVSVLVPSPQSCSLS
jgi:hypothetical protein